MVFCAPSPNEWLVMLADIIASGLIVFEANFAYEFLAIVEIQVCIGLKEGGLVTDV